MWFTIIESVGKILHWITGFFVHPEKGGCCHGLPEFKKDEDLKNKK